MQRNKRSKGCHVPPGIAPKSKQVKVGSDFNVPPGLPAKCDSKQSKVKNHPDVHSGLPPNSGGVNYKKNILLAVSKKIANNEPPPGSIEKDAAAERCGKPADYANESRGSSSVAHFPCSNNQRREGRTGSVIETNFLDFVDLENRVGRLERLAAFLKSQ